MSKNVMEWVMGKVVINTTNNHWSFAVTRTVTVRNGVFPAISVNKDVTVFSTCSPV